MATRRTRRLGVKAVQNKPLDDSHSPFKRAKRLGPGPKRKVREATDEWTCTWVKPYVQKCVKAPSRKGGKKRVKIIKRDPKKVKAYNKAHWESQVSAREHGGGPKYSNSKRAGYHYRKPSAPKRTRKPRQRKRS